MEKVNKILTILLLLNSTLGLGQTYSFKQGVALSHWTGNMPSSGKFGFADPEWFAEKDVEWISKTGLDHIQVYCALNDFINKEGIFIAERLAVLDSLISWNKKRKMGVIVSPTRFPDVTIDTTLSREKQTEKRIEAYAVLCGQFSEHFKTYGEILRFALDIGSKDKNERKSFFEKCINEIRNTNPVRKIYLTAYHIEKLDDIYVPSNDKNIIIAAKMGQYTVDKADALDVFVWQHSFDKKIPLVQFPGAIPPLKDSMLVDEDKWVSKYAGIKLNKRYIDTKLKKIKKWKNNHYPNLEFYISNWRYWSGFPFDPHTLKDAKSISNFGKAFTKSAKKHQIGWCIYDYNSGSCIRYPNGEKALILKAMQLK
jgi:hypothetical protein